MAQNYYGSNKPVTLQDLLAQANSQPDAPTSAPAPPSPSQIETPGVMNQQDRQKILDMLLAPDSVGPEPEVDKTNALSLLFTGLGDAINAGVAASTQNPGLKSNTMDQYLQRINNQKEELRAYKERKLKSERDAKHRTANYLLSADDRAREDKARLASQKEANAYRDQKDKAEAVQHIADQAQVKAMADEANATRLKIEEMGNKAKVQSDSMQLQLHKLRQNGEGDTAQHKEYATIRQGIVQQRRAIEKGLASGEITPEQVLQDWQDTLDATDLAGPYKEAANAFFQDKYGVLLMRYAPSQNLPPRNDQGITLPTAAGNALSQHGP